MKEIKRVIEKQASKYILKLDIPTKNMSDPDYVKLTKEERQNLDIALESDDYIDFDEFKKSLSIAE